MKKLKLFPIIIILLFLIFDSCSKKVADKIIGKWKTENGGLTFEFTNDNKMITSGENGIYKYNSVTSYSIKSDDGNKLVLVGTNAVDFSTLGEHFKDEKSSSMSIIINEGKLFMSDIVEGKESNPLILVRTQ